MKPYIRSHIKYYAIHGILQFIGFLVLLSLGNNRTLQIAVICTSSIGYVTWSILHHYQQHSLSTKIVLEYVVFGTFGIVASLLYL